MLRWRPPARGWAPPRRSRRAAEPHVEALAGLDDPNLAARAADLRSIARRAGELARGGGSSPPEGAIVLAEDLGPGDVAAWAGIVAGIVLVRGRQHRPRRNRRPLAGGAAGHRCGQPACCRSPTARRSRSTRDRGLVLRSVDADTRDRLLRRIGLAAEEAERAKRRAPGAVRDLRRPGRAAAGERGLGGGGRGRAGGRRRGRRTAAQRAGIPRCIRLAVGGSARARLSRRC